MDKKRLRPLVNAPGIWESLMEWLDEEEHMALQNLKNAEKPELLYRTQGYLKMIDKLRGLKANVNVE